MFFNRKPSSKGVEYLIVGLGNPGAKYEMTRHNAGFIVVDELAKRLGVGITKKAHQALCVQAEVAGKRCLIMKPQTFMNESGKAVADAARFYKVPTEKVLVIFDDISLDVGSLRIRRKGSSGGHNGIKSIGTYIGDDFPRVKVGVGAKPHPDYDLAAWVLSKFKPDEVQPLNTATQKACDAVEYIVAGETDRAMNLFN